MMTAWTALSACIGPAIFYKSQAVNRTDSEPPHKRVVVYAASNGIHAHIIKGLLAQYEIPAFIAGEFLQGGIGEIPPTFDIVKVSVDTANQLAAKTIIRQWEAGDLAQADGPD